MAVAAAAAAEAAVARAIPAVTATASLGEVLRSERFTGSIGGGAVAGGIHRIHRWRCCGARDSPRTLRDADDS